MASGSPDFSPRIVSSGSGDEQVKQDCTAVLSSATFSQTVLSVIVYNDGASPVHIKRGAVVTTNDFKLPAKAWFMTDVPTTLISFICAAGQTATCYLVGVF